MSRILVIRFSALGDVAMTIPVIYSLANQYPEHQFTVLSKEPVMPLFSGLPLNVDFMIGDLKGKHKGIAGLNLLFSELHARNFDCVADLHHVLRTRYLSFRFRLVGVPVASICKGRWGKRKLVRKRNKLFKRQPNSFERYTNVFQQLGFPVKLRFTSIYGEGKGVFELIQPYTGEKGTDRWIGIAPFAKHKGKIYPLHLQEQVIAHFARKKGVKLFLFGGGEEEKLVFSQWAAKYPTAISMIGKLNMKTELVLISHLDVMLSMDSANMHLASLVHTPVVSVWGATHPYCGFMGWNQSLQNAAQVNLPCRPCSVFGQKACYRKDYACLNLITPEMVIQKIEHIVTERE